MDFSSADVPISRETWAPRSPPRQSSNGPPPSGLSPPPRDSRDRERESYGAPPDQPSSREPYSRPSEGAYRAPSGDYSRDSRDAPYSSSRDRDAPYAPRDGSYAPPAPRRPPTAPSADPNNVLGVFGLSIRTRERDLEDEFARYGDVEKVVIVYDQRTDRSRGFGFITMRDTDGAAAAIEKLNGFNLHGRNIRVDYSATVKPHQPTPGQYMGQKRPVYEDRYQPRGGYDDRGRGGRYDDRDRGRYDDRRGAGRYDDRGGRDRDYPPRRDYDDPYGGRSRREDDRRRDASPPRRSAAGRHSSSPDRRPPPRDYDAPPADAAQRY